MCKKTNENQGHGERAKELFLGKCNCAQSVVGAFCDITGMDFNYAMRLSSSFGGGMGRLREVCGALTGAFMVIGVLFGYDDLEDKDAKDKHYTLIQHVAERFKDRTGSIICRELLSLPSGKDVPVSSERTEKYYTSRPCTDFVQIAAEIVDEIILERGLEKEKNRL